MVTGAHFRHPAVLAKTVTTLDVLSGGRAWLGIGTGHYEEECDGLGVPFPALAKRYELLEDALEVCTRMWAGDQGDDRPFDGHQISAARLLNVPQALQRPRPPILIAGAAFLLFRVAGLSPLQVIAIAAVTGFFWVRQ